MSRPKFATKINQYQIQQLLVRMKNIGISYTPIPSSFFLPDESDRIFYDTAKSTNSVLITGNTRHFPGEPFIVSPASFLREYVVHE
jgi:hypothetical protein